MGGDANKDIILIMNLYLSVGPAFFQINLTDFIGNCYGVIDEYWAQEADLVHPNGNGGFRFIRPTIGDSERRDGRNEADKERPMRHSASVSRIFHVGFVDVVWRKITSNACKHINIRFAYCLGECRGLPDPNMKF